MIPEPVNLDIGYPSLRFFSEFLKFLREYYFYNHEDYEHCLADFEAMVASSFRTLQAHERYRELDRGSLLAVMLSFNAPHTALSLYFVGMDNLRNNFINMLRSPEFGRKCMDRIRSGRERRRTGDQANQD